MFLNQAINGADLTLKGKGYFFQSLGLATEKAQFPFDLKLHLETF